LLYFKRLLLPLALVILALALWNSDAFQQIAAGIAIFLFGMLSLEQGFRAFSGGLFEHLLQRCTDRLWKSLLFGMTTTSLMQSSSLVSILSISFLSAGLISLGTGLGIIFGANLGTTTGAWLIAAFGLKIKISAYAMPLLVFGVALLFQDKKCWQGVGQILAGIGFLFLGIHHMKEGFSAFQSDIDLQFAITSTPLRLLAYTATGIAATVIMQSSHASLVLILTGLSAGHIVYQDALALAIGANVGTTITAILGSLSANNEGRQLAAGHLIFNLVTGGVALLCLPLLLAMVEWLAGQLALTDDDYTLRLAIFHSLFNALGIVLMLPWLSRLQQWLTQWLPATSSRIKRTKYLNDAALQSSRGALQVARKESRRLYRFSRDIIIRAIGWSSRDYRHQQLPRSGDGLPEMAGHDIRLAYDTRLKHLHADITRFISLARENARGKKDEALRQLSVACFHMIEAVKDTKHMQRNLISYCSNQPGSNAAMAATYQQLREIIAANLLVLDRLQHNDNDDGQELLLELEHRQLLLQRQQRLLDERIDELIRQQAIDPLMATSLMNDKEYALRLVSNLIKAVRSLSGHYLHNSLPPLDENELTLLNQTLALDTQLPPGSSSQNTTSPAAQTPHRRQPE